MNDREMVYLSYTSTISNQNRRKSLNKNWLIYCEFNLNEFNSIDDLSILRFLTRRCLLDYIWTTIVLLLVVGSAPLTFERENSRRLRWFGVNLIELFWLLNGRNAKKIFNIDQFNSNCKFRVSKNWKLLIKTSTNP